MTHHDMNTPTPDYGEPWSIQEGHLSTSLFDGKGAYFADIHELVGEDSSVAWAKAERIIACVNACSKMADPAKEIASLRGERDCLNRELSDICRVADAHTADEACEVIRAMREAIREAHTALDGCLKYMLGVSVCNLDLECETMDAAHHALAKLKPFIK